MSMFEDRINDGLLGFGERGENLYGRGRFAPKKSSARLRQRKG
jgi:hypothetical protein